MTILQFEKNFLFIVYGGHEMVKNWEHQHKQYILLKVNQKFYPTETPHT